MKKVYQNGVFQGFLDEEPLTVRKNNYSMPKNSLGDNTSVISNEEDTKDNLKINKGKPMLKLITGGGEPPAPTGNWLLDLEIGTKFCVQSKDIKNFMCLDLEIVGKTQHTVVLYELSTGMPFANTGRVVASRFTALFDKVEILPSYQEMLNEALGEGENDNDGNRSDALEEGRSSGDLGDDDRVKEQPKGTA